MSKNVTFKNRFSAETVRKIVFLAGCIIVGAIFGSSEGNILFGALMGFPLYWTLRFVIKLFGGLF